ncbi:MAG TPA: family 10 glycosylhydrolase [Terriglobales bacterium]|nr:family 10 glycosylhydrolase [Terriglobales bacterium]
MNRREFLKAASGAASFAVGKYLPAQVLGADRRESALKHWLWIPLDTQRSDDDWKRSFALARESGVRAILPEIYDGRNAYFPSQHLPVKTDLLAKFLRLGKTEDLEVHAWMWSMPCMIPEIMQKHADWYNVNARGESAVDKPAYVDYYKFLDPGRPEVREWVQATVRELASIAELTGIHLDYIRHPDAILPKGLWAKYKIVQDKVYPQYDYGYSEYERKRFKQQYGADPLEIKGGELEQKWLRFRWDMVTDLVNDYLVPAAQAKSKMITAAVFPGPTLARQMVRQDWGRWKLDAFLPMLYNNFYETGPEWVRAETQEAVSTVAKPVYSGLFVHDMNNDAFTRTVEMALEGGASGVSIFSLDAMDRGKWSALRRAARRIVG